MPNRAMQKWMMLAAVLLTVLNSGTLRAQKTQAPAVTETQQPAPVAQQPADVTPQAALAGYAGG